jgi:predicted metalloprotease with PDZ domain
MSDPFCYTVRFPSPVHHYAEVDAEFPVVPGGDLELFMAVWTPGSYLVREYARHIEDLSATDSNGKLLPVRRTRKNRWLVKTIQAGTVKVTYRVYCREMSVRTNWVDERFALLQGAALFLSVPGELSRAHDITLVLPPDWPNVVTALPEASDAGKHHFLARDFDMLVDCPILAGNPSVHEFEVERKSHALANEGEDGLWDATLAVTDLEKLVRENLKFWGSLPYDKYVYLNVIGDGGGGLEHKNSFCIISSPFATRTRKGYLEWLELASHEYFHTWNVKRLRPADLGPFDYENENYSRALWVSEGFTEYYGSLMVKRAGLASREEYLAGVDGSEPDKVGLSGLIELLQTTPGRLTQPVEMASYDAWIKAYRPDENSKNTRISYYTKGAVIAFLFDARIRKATDGAKSLDDVMRAAYERYSGSKGFTDTEFRGVIQEVAGVEMESWLTAALETTEELDYSEALDYYGLRFKPLEPAKPGAAMKSYTGFTTKTDGGRLLIKEVLRGTPAFRAGLSVDDEILAIADRRVLADHWPQRMEQLHPGETVLLLVARRGRLVRVDILLGEEPGRKWTLEVRPDSTSEQTRHLNSWLGG